MNALVEILTVSVVMLTQGALIFGLFVLVAVLAFPDKPMVQFALKWLKDLL